jgi:carboxyl-terminal processing protease
MEMISVHRDASPRRIWRILKWTVVALVVSIIALLVASAAIAVRHERSAFEKLSPRERHLAIYDAFCTQIKKHYFDPSFSSVDWKQIDQKWRERAAAATSDADLYTNVLGNIGLQFPASHVGATQASPMDQTPTTGVLLNVPGFYIAWPRRGTRAVPVVDDVLPGWGADRAGVEPGWLVKNLQVTGLHVAAEFWRLTPQEELRNEQSLQADDAAATIIKLEYDFDPRPLPAALETRRLPGGGLYIRFDTFRDSKLMEQVLTTLDQADSAGVVIDLRRNAGGFEPELRLLLDRLLQNRSHIGSERSAAGVTEWRTADHARTYSGPLAVLIGPMTASAAETFAAAIQDNARGRLLGRMTQGSVLVSQFFPLPDGGFVNVPVSDFVRSGGKRIEGVGVEPDIRVMPSLEEIRAGRDPVVERAVLELREGMNSQ